MKITKFQTAILNLTLIGLATIICYGNCLWFDFVFDDFATVKYSPVVKDPQTLVDILTLKILTKDILDNVRPVTVLFTWLDFQIWGINPFGFHLTNLILHVICCFLVYVLAGNIFSSLENARNNQAANGSRTILSGHNIAALATAILFAIHPVHSEAVCGISYRDDLLCTLFFLTALILFQMVITNKSSWVALIPASASLFLSGLSKEMVFSFPFVLILFVVVAGMNKVGLLKQPYWKIPRVCVPVLASILIISLLYYLCFIYAKRDIALFAGYKPGYLGGSLWSTLPASMKIAVFYLAKLIWPINLSPDYPLYRLAAISNVLLFVVLGTLLITARWLWRRTSVGFFGLGFLFITLLPVSNLFPLFRPIADRYLYLPSIGWCLFLVSSLRYIVFKVIWSPADSKRIKGKSVGSKKRRKTNSSSGLQQTISKGILLVFCIYLVTLSVMTIKQNRIWRDSLSFWSYTVKANPTSSIALNNLAYAYLDTAEYEKALNVWENFLFKFGEKEPDALAGMAVALYRMGRHKEALIMFRKAVGKDPSYRNAELLKTIHFWKPDWIRDVQSLLEDSKYKSTKSLKHPKKDS
jgi:hypothetical protein